MIHRRRRLQAAAGLALACLLVVAACGPGRGAAPTEGAPAVVGAEPAATPVQAPGTVAPAPLPAPATTTTTTAAPTTTTPPRTTTTLAPDPVGVAMADLSLEEKVGQLFMVEVHGLQADEASAAEARLNRSAFDVASAAEVVTEQAVGGVIYFEHNTQSPVQLAELSGGLQRAAGSRPGVGLLIAVDEEGGRVSRAPPPAVVFPSARAMGKLDDPELVRRIARVMGTELRAMGVNTVFAPVVDLDLESARGVIGDRSYGSEPALVAAMASAVVSGFGDASVAATAKHFPGHGRTAVDSHQQLPRLNVSRDTWLATDREPFAAAVSADVPAVMIGHLAAPALDAASGPATLSAAIVDGELRAGLGFDGVVITDSLRMGGVRSASGDADIAVNAILAGADILLMPQDLAVAKAAVVDAVAAGVIDERRIDRSVRRVLQLKHQLGVLEPPKVDAGFAALVVGSTVHHEVLAEVLAACVAAGIRC